MVRKSGRCLGSRMKHMKSNKDDPIMINDTEVCGTVYKGDDEYELRGPTCTQIMLYEEKKYVKPDVVFETPKTKMAMHDRGEESELMNEGDRSSDIPPNKLLESDENNLPIAKRRLFKDALKGKGKTSETENVQCIIDPAKE
ncbi:Cell division protein ftsH [Cucumis melo var. makuwa]|uniref:Cell division protein ftsH n=1 Tax=Cucumis melo var. makuwa TaxID=1194695 RepID=A0A5A7VKG5_CUCMM|nr:Cell division protein ftsH [Cucumis melo var. makuwa]TYK30198.1 Cell division protein ftsH [Cucumis melo var. makuwa]